MTRIREEEEVQNVISTAHLQVKAVERQYSRCYVRNCRAHWTLVLHLTHPDKRAVVLSCSFLDRTELFKVNVTLSTFLSLYFPNSYEFVFVST